MLAEKKSPLTGRKVEALRTLIQYQTGNKNIEIIHNPNAELKTDGKRIWLPWISDDVFEEYAGLLHAGVLHEGAHIKRSDFPILRDKKAIPNQLVLGFANAIEDTRIERYESQQYSSLKLEFRRFNEFYKRDYIKTKDSHENRILTDPQHFFFLVGYCVDLYLADYEYDYLPESVLATFNQIKDIVDDYRTKEIDGPKGSLIAVAAANDIYKRLKDLFSKLPEVSIDGEGEPDNKEENNKENTKDKKKKQSGDKRETDDEEGEEGEESEDMEGGDDDGGEGSGDENKDDDATGSDSEGDEEGTKGSGEVEEEAESKGKGSSSEDDNGDEEGTGETGEEGDSRERKAKKGDEKSLSGTPVDDDDNDEEDDEEDKLPSLDDFDMKVDGNEPTTETEHCGSIETKVKDKGSKKNPKDITSSMEKAIKAAAEAGTTLDFTRFADPGGEDDGGGDFLNPSKMLDMAKDAGIKTIREQYYEALREKIVEKESSGPTQHMPHPLAMARDVIFTPNIDATNPQRQFYAKLREELAPEIGRLKSQLLSLIMSQKRVHFAPDSEEGEVDTAALHSLRHGNKRIFSSHTWGRDLNTAIEILVDCSGSMGSDGKAMGAMKAAIALSEVLAILKIPFEVTGFTTDARMIKVDHEEGNIYNRIEGLVHFIFKAFEENFGTVKYRLLSIRAQNNNCDGESVMWAAQRLFRCKEKRKILFVFSDGMPACYSSSHPLLEADLKETVKKIEQMGAEVYGIGIFTDAPKHFYSEHSEITRYADKSIASAIFECLKRKLTQGVPNT